jgi:hypothetical protein
MFLKSLVMKRILMSIALGLLIGVLVSEVPFLFLRDTARMPREIVMTIPAGTADQVARGEQPPSIPQSMVFVVGDRLVVKNEDSTDHKLGPLWIPAKSSAQLLLEQEENLAYECTFQPSKYFGLDVYEALTPATRIYGIFYIAIPMAILIALYSFVMPQKKKTNAVA